MADAPFDFKSFLQRTREHQRKRLKDPELDSFVKALQSGILNDVQLCAWLVTLKHSEVLSLNETAKLTSALIAQSQKIVSNDEWSVTDYYSTDIIGDNRYLIIVPVLAALGLKVPSIQVEDKHSLSLDKLKCIPGFNPSLTLEQMNSMISDIGCFLGYSQEISIVDNKVSAVLEDIGSTLQDSQLDLARLFSQKLSCGSTALLFDIKCDGNKNKYPVVLKESNDIVALTKELGVRSRVQISDAAVPYGDKIGYNLELQDIFEVLDGEGSSEMIDVVALQCAHILQMTGKIETLRDGEKKVFEVLADGSALTKFLAMISAQGVADETIKLIKAKEYSKIFCPAEHQEPLECPVPGIVRDIRLDIIEKAVYKLGGYNHDAGEGCDARVGLDFHVGVGCRIGGGSPWVTVHHNGRLTPELKKELNRALIVEKVDFHRIIRTVRNDGPKKGPKKGGKRKGRKNTDTAPDEVPDEAGPVEQVDTEAARVDSASSSESVPKDYVVVVDTDKVEDEGSNERTVTMTKNAPAKETSVDREE